MCRVLCASVVVVVIVVVAFVFQPVNIELPASVATKAPPINRDRLSSSIGGRIIISGGGGTFIDGYDVRDLCEQGLLGTTRLFVDDVEQDCSGTRYNAE